MQETIDTNNEVKALMEFAQSFSGQKKAEVTRLFNTLSAGSFPGDTRLGGISDLNNDGSPWQVCLSADAEQIKLRLITDPASALLEPELRLAASREILEKTLRFSKAESLQPQCDQLFQAVLHHHPGIDLTSFYRGFCWIGASPSEPGVALYLDTFPLGTMSAWDMIEQWLSHVLPDATEAKQLIENLRIYAIPASVGLEAVSPQNGRAKIYWRLKQPVPLSSLSIAPLQRPEIAQFLAMVIEKREMRLEGTVFCTGFDLLTGCLTDAKIDLCAHCLPRPAEEWSTLVDHLTSTFHIQKPAIRKTLNSGQTSMAFIGMRVPVNGSPKLNVYLKPAYHFPAGNMAERIILQSEKAVHYLCHIQAKDGSWGDYFLPVGMAIDWVTAYVGCALAEIGTIKGFEKATLAAQQAADFLQSQRNYAQGWGYNAHTGADADSTAWTLRLFQLTGRKPETPDIEFLRSHWKGNGGFSTYQTDDCWGHVHPCVTAVAYRSLPSELQEKLRPGLNEYLKKYAPANGQWPAYWWKNHLYSTYHHLQLLNTLNINENEFYAVPAPLSIPAVSAFEQALAMGIMQYRGQDIQDTCDRLLYDQLPDGRWPGGYNLRVTAPDCAQPWKDPQGKLYNDRAGTITTATVLSILKNAPSLWKT